MELELVSLYKPGLAPDLYNAPLTFVSQCTGMWTWAFFPLPAPTSALKVPACQWPAWITASSLFLGPGSYHLLDDLSARAFCSLTNVLH